MTATLDQDTLIAASSPAGFAYVATRGNPEPYIPANFHLAMAEGIVDVEQGRLELLVNTAPVQHGKTWLTSVWSSAWMLGLHPRWHVIAATYNTDFAEDKIGGPARDILERHGGRYFGISVDQSSRSMKRWRTTQGGGMLAVGVDKPVTGRRGDFIVLDDVYADLVHAMNAKHRADIVEWFKANVLTRRPDPLRMTATMSRWTDDDFIAWILHLAKENGWKYRLLDFPAIAVCRVDECDRPILKIARNDETGVVEGEMELCDHQVRDELGRLPGEALWPAVRPISFLLRQLADLLPRLFTALFQGRPQRAGGSTFKQEWFRYCQRTGDAIQLISQAGDVVKTYLLSICKVFQIVDLASGDTTTLRSGITRVKARPDYTVVGTFALCPRNELAVLDIYRDNRIEGPEQITLLGQLRNKFRAGRIGIEAVAYQWVAVQAAVKAGLPAVPITRGNESKETRAWTIAARYETGQVFHLRGAPWVDALETELVQFPNGSNDDQVDVLSDAGAVVAEAVHRPTPGGVYVA
jgi:predicted phage terminase large subunit-like protein